MIDDLKEFKTNFTVMASDVDMKGNLKPHILLDYLQNTAWAHYMEVEKIVGKILDENYIWLISRLKIILKEIPKWQDMVTVKTYATDINGYFAYRNFEIIKKEKIIGNSTFLWLIKDKIKNKLIKPENFVKKFPINSAERFFDLKEKIPEISGQDKGEKIKVKYSDIDVNNHVNNARYLQWAIDCVDENILKEKCFKEI